MDEKEKAEKKPVAVGDVLPLGQSDIGLVGNIVKVNGEGRLRRRLFDMGLTPGAEVFVRKRAPLGDPIEITLRGYELTLRKSEADFVDIKVTDISNVKQKASEEEA